MQCVGGSQNGGEIWALKRDVSSVMGKTCDGHVDVGTSFIPCMVRIWWE